MRLVAGGRGKPQSVLKRLRELEVELHQPQVRSNRVRLLELLHPSFVEIGRSGRYFTREAILRELAGEASEGKVWSQDFRLNPVADDIAILTYRSCRLHSNGEVSHFAHRSSVWRKAGRDWQLYFHQGTPVEPFETA